jgi:hypothetical protein
MQDFLKETTISLRSFLQRSLPEIMPDWWARCVLCNLTESQIHLVRERGITNLEGLDLAALLRVFDANYFDLSQRLRLPRQTRNWLKELQHIRNRWAHHTGETDSPDEAVFIPLVTPINPRDERWLAKKKPEFRGAFEL